MKNYNECWTSKGGKEKKKTHAQQDYSQETEITEMSIGKIRL